MKSALRFLLLSLLSSAAIAGALPKSLNYRGNIEFESGRNTRVEMFLSQKYEDSEKGRYKGLFRVITEDSPSAKTVRMTVRKLDSGRISVQGEVVGQFKLVFDTENLRERDLFLNTLRLNVEILNDRLCTPSEPCDGVTRIVDSGVMYLNKIK
jgi:hypothetical protein